jgi:hypothetical protein
MLGLSVCILAVIGQAVGPSGSPARSADVLNVLEDLVRTVAAESCDGSSCYVSVDGKPPSDRFRERLRRVPHVRAMPTSGLPPAQSEGAIVVDLSSVYFRSASKAEAQATVLWGVGGQLLATESCRYQFARQSQRWELQASETRCLVL